MKNAYRLLLTVAILFVVAATGPGTATAGGGGAGGLRAVLPADCLILVETPSFQGFCEQIAGFGKRFNPQMTWQNVSNELLKDTSLFPKGMATLLVQQGPLAVAFFEPDKHEQPVLLFRVRDKDQFLANTVKKAKAGEGPDKDGLWWYAQNEHTTYHFSMTGGTVILSQDRPLVMKVVSNTRSKKPTHMEGSKLSGSLVASFNLKQVNKLYRAKLRDELKKATQMASVMEAANAGNKDGNAKGKEKKEPSSIEQFMEMAGKTALTLLESSEDASIALQLDKKGLTFGLEYSADKNSELGKAISKIKASNFKALQLLPAETIYAESTHVGAASADFMNIFQGVVGDAKGFKNLMEKSKAVSALMTGEDATGLVPPGAGTNGFGTVIALIGSKDAAKLLTESEKLEVDNLKSINEFLSMLGAEMELSKREKAFEHKGVTVWKQAFGIKLVQKADAGAGAQMAKQIMPIMNALLDKGTGKSMLSAAMDGFVVTTLGSEPDKWMRTVLDNIKKGEAAFTKAPWYQGAFRSKPDGAFAVEVIKLVDMVGVLAHFVAQLGEPLGMGKHEVGMIDAIGQMAQGGKSGIGAFLRAEGDTVIGEIHIPDKHVTEITGLGQAIFMRMMMMGQRPREEEEENFEEGGETSYIR